MPGPGDDGVEDGGTVHDSEFVVAGGLTTSLLEMAEPAFDDVAVAIVGRVEARWPASVLPTRVRDAMMARPSARARAIRDRASRGLLGHHSLASA